MIGLSLGNSGGYFRGSKLGAYRVSVDGTLVGQDLGADKGYVVETIVDQYLGDTAKVPLGSSICGTIGFIGGEDLGLTYYR